MSMVNKEAIVTHIARATGLKKADAERAYDATLEAIKNGLTSGQDVRLSSIGSLKTKLAKERKSRNPRSGELIIVPERREVRFTVSKELKEAVAFA